QGASGNTLDSLNKIYGLNTIPNTLLSQDEITVKINARNFGSLTWSPGGENPVYLTYRWVREFNSNLTPEIEYGNAAVLTDNVNWNQSTGVLDLKVFTPVYPGNYRLEIDTVHA